MRVYFCNLRSSIMRPGTSNRGVLNGTHVSLIEVEMDIKAIGLPEDGPPSTLCRPHLVCVAELEQFKDGHTVKSFVYGRTRNSHFSPKVEQK